MKVAPATIHIDLTWQTIFNWTACPPLFIIVAPLTSGFFKQLVTAANFPVCQRIA